jgi:DNA-binding NtrC family response regulator
MSFQKPFVPLEEMERTYILSVLTHTKGNKTEAARILGIERKTLARKLRRADGGDMDDLEGGES